MNREEIEDILDELHLVRPEILKPKAKKLFEAIMSIADERDELQQENDQLKADYGNKAQVERDLLLEEVKELKKQLEEYRRLGFKHLNDKCNKLENQQKEFILYLENEINEIKDVKYSLTIDVQKTVSEVILSKYKEIIGGKDEELSKNSR